MSDSLTEKIDELRAVLDVVDGVGEFGPGPDADEVQVRFDRDDAVEFYTLFNPSEVQLESVVGVLALGSFQELPELQEGYATVGGVVSSDWPIGRWVIGAVDANPLTLPHSDGEVCFDLVGSGVWHPRPIAHDLGGLLDILIAWAETVREHGDNLRDETYDVRPAALEDFAARARRRGIDEAHLTNLLELR